MISYFIVFLATAVLCCLAAVCCKRVNPDGTVSCKKTLDVKILLFFAIATLAVTAGCRYHVGTDYSNYIFLYYTEYIRTPWKDLIGLNEPILPMIAKLSDVVFGSYYAMFFIASVITVGLALYSTYKETTDFLFVTAIFVFAGCWHGSFNGIRQYMAVTIVYLGRKYIFERKFWKYLLICFVAFLAHKSAAIGILIYFAYSEKYSTKKLLWITAASVAIALNYENVFRLIGWLNESEFVQTEYSARSVNIFRVLVGCVPAALGIYFASRKKLDKEQVFYVYMLVANAAIRVATMNSAYLARLGAYTGIMVPLGLSCILRAWDKKEYQLIKALTITLYGAYWLYEIMISDTLREFEWIFGNM